MPITDHVSWQQWVDANKDPYGKACIDVARRAMEIMDENDQPLDCWGIISRADRESGAGGITGFMAGCVASMVAKCHSRGEEFRKLWNRSTQIGDEGEKANRDGGVLNPALLTVGTKEG